ncbi:hypothetical protein A0H81_04869 [Grifola frondosa]|uniref:DUF6593 domain-containing protein n=1 Tax=Grifola frondosa TaxID=5627 RepID=A0A1C7MFG1_GRIFR|nr:hypothetical protein A0H81_04869 [Grifola frondosa]
MTQKLSLTTTSLRNVVISNATDIIYYEVVTPKWERHLTRINRLDPNTREFDLIGELRNEDDKPVAIRFYGGSFKPVEEFLRSEGDSPNMSDLRPSALHCRCIGTNRDESRTACFKGKDGKRYTWSAEKKHLKLMREDTPDKPVAVYCKQKRFLYVLRMSEHPCLEVDVSTIDVLDHLIGTPPSPMPEQSMTTN